MKRFLASVLVAMLTLGVVVQPAAAADSAFHPSDFAFSNRHFAAVPTWTESDLAVTVVNRGSETVWIGMMSIGIVRPSGDQYTFDMAHYPDYVGTCLGAVLPPGGSCIVGATFFGRVKGPSRGQICVGGPTATAYIVGCDVLFARAY